MNTCSSGGLRKGRATTLGAQPPTHEGSVWQDTKYVDNQAYEHVKKGTSHVGNPRQEPGWLVCRFHAAAVGVRDFARPYRPLTVKDSSHPTLNPTPKHAGRWQESGETALRGFEAF